MGGNVFFNPIPFHSQWFIPIPIPDPRFSLFYFHSFSVFYWLFPLPPAPIFVLLVRISTDLYEVPDAVPPIHAVSSHEATDKDPSK